MYPREKWVELRLLAEWWMSDGKESFGAVSLETVRTERAKDAGDLEWGMERKARDVSRSRNTKCNTGGWTGDLQDDEDDEEKGREC